MATATKERKTVKTQGKKKTPPPKATIKAKKLPTTVLSFLLDESGSMGDVRDDTIGGFNTFIDKQRKEPGEMLTTLVKFDSQEPYNVVFADRPIKKVPDLTLETYSPRGGTPLVDSAYRMITETEERTRKYKKDEVRVLIILQTDGHENASTKHTTQGLKSLIERKQADGWVFVFLGADINAYGMASAVGITRGNTVSYGKDFTSDTFRSLNQHTSGFRASSNMAAAAGSMQWNSEEKLNLGDKFDPDASAIKGFSKGTLKNTARRV